MLVKCITKVHRLSGFKCVYDFAVVCSITTTLVEAMAAQGNFLASAALTLPLLANLMIAVCLVKNSDASLNQSLSAL